MPSYRENPISHHTNVCCVSIHVHVCVFSVCPLMWDCWQIHENTLRIEPLFTVTPLPPIAFFASLSLGMHTVECCSVVDSVFFLVHAVEC